MGALGSIVGGAGGMVWLAPPLCDSLTSHHAVALPAQPPVISSPLMGKQIREGHRGLRLKQPELWLQPLCFLNPAQRQSWNFPLNHTKRKKM